MKRLLVPLLLIALLSGCVAVPHDASVSYRSTGVVSGHVSSGYRNTYSSGYYSPAPVYVSPAPIYVRPAPVHIYSAPMYRRPAPVIRHHHRHQQSAPLAVPHAPRHVEHRRDGPRHEGGRRHGGQRADDRQGREARGVDRPRSERRSRGEREASADETQRRVFRQR